MHNRRLEESSYSDDGIIRRGSASRDSKLSQSVPHAHVNFMVPDSDTVTGNAAADTGNKHAHKHIKSAHVQSGVSLNAVKPKVAAAIYLLQGLSVILRELSLIVTNLNVNTS